jgi:hypothetical protein
MGYKPDPSQVRNQGFGDSVDGCTDGFGIIRLKSGDILRTDFSLAGMAI